MRYTDLTLLLILALSASACQSTSQTTSGDDPQGTAHTTSATHDTPAAYLDGVVVTRGELYGYMVEAQGGQALSELLLDRAITRRLTQEGIELSQADYEAERTRLLDSLDPDRDVATRLLQQMRTERGLGDLRFASLLRRNAGLRSLIRADVTISEPAIQQAFDLRYGPRYTVRLITLPTVDRLAAVRRRVIEGESFTDMASAQSTDPSSRQGGLLSPISPADATYPQSIRDALAGLSLDSRAQRLSPVIALPEGYALLWLEDIMYEHAPPLDEVRDELARGLRQELERVRMQQLARVLISQVNAIVLDPALDASWQTLRQTIVEP